MDVEITARGARITDRFEAYAEEKLEKIGLLLPRATSIAMRVSRHADPNATAGGRVEITVLVPGSVIRSEAEGPDKYIAFDAAFHKLMERARRIHDKRTDRSVRRASLRDVAVGTGGLDVTPASVSVLEAVATGEVPIVDDEQEWSPVVIRRKQFPSKRMTTRQAVDQMELVGHPFYLFVDAETDQCAVVYRRKGWSYGVITLEGETTDLD
ncbi:ribosome hibernation-promoting factor, HPF/YfiA family [Agrococcus jejuensis]|uniref:Ribosome hibernation promoting factor n=1 Tax=Agrococcus jejuensis TaxID=399736 RepID=A0A1G8B618_9MICO|nr:ribosome-associated translation inhibitor RaiA [Agrococcus jejuensis]SDH28669.1 ribosomal subunit interface protein [Agrococcus jejuensis]